MLIADSGSTKTDWILKDQNGLTERFQSAGINPFFQTEEDISSVLGRDLLPYLSKPVGEIFFYGAGCADAKSGEPVMLALKKAFQSSTQIEVASDMLGAARGLCGHASGLACILGTGANNAFFDGANIVRSIGSLGFWLGDEGSGSYLGKTLVVHYLQRELPEDLNEMFHTQFPEMDRLYVLDMAYKKPFPNRFFATFSKFISENIGHPFIQQLVKSAFELFVNKYVVKHQDVEKYPVHFTGSVAFYYQDILKSVLLEKGLIPGNIEKSPLEGLVKYHE